MVDGSDETFQLREHVQKVERIRHEEARGNASKIMHF